MDKTKDLTKVSDAWLELLGKDKFKFYYYHTEIDEAFQQDCENLLLAFEKQNSFAFKVFAEVWQNMHFSQIFVGQEFVEELLLFTETCFSTIKKYILFSQNAHIQVGAIYMLYGIYYKQPAKNKVRIRVTQEDLTVILKLHNKMVERDQRDFIFIVLRMRSDNAFKYVATHSSWGIEAKFAWQKKHLTNNIFKTGRKSDPLPEVTKFLFTDDQINLKSVDAINKQYIEDLKKYELVNEEEQNRASNFVHDLKKLYNKMNDSIDQESSSSKSSGESIQKKREKLRATAFKATVSKVRTFE